MASFKDSGRGDGPKRRSDASRRRRQGLLDMERLEQRRLLASATVSGPPTWHPTSTNPYDAQNGPLANLGADLVTIYHEYENYVQGGSQGAFKSSKAGEILISGNLVGVDLKGYGDFNAYTQALTNLGMHVTATAPTIGIAEGWAPIQALPSIARQSQTVGGQAIYRNLTNAGKATNQGDMTTFANVARTQFNVTGAGQQVGVLSDSFSQTLGGYADSMRTGDLPAGVKVIQDSNPMLNANPTDEGRGMLEDVYDIAPGAGLAFATGDVGDVGFANNIKALAAAGFDGDRRRPERPVRPVLPARDHPVSRGRRGGRPGGQLPQFGGQPQRQRLRVEFRPISRECRGHRSGDL